MKLHGLLEPGVFPTEISYPESAGDAATMLSVFFSGEGWLTCPNSAPKIYHIKNIIKLRMQIHNHVLKFERINIDNQGKT